MNGAIRPEAELHGHSLEQLDMHGISAQTILDALGAAFVVLDDRLAIASTNPAFCKLAGISADAALGHRILDVANGAWNSAGLEQRLTRTLDDAEEFADFQVESEMPGIGRRIYKLAARRIDAPAPRVLLTIDDVTAAVAADRHKDLLVAEMAHRIKNSLSVIGAFLTLEISRGLGPCRDGYRAMQTRLAAVASLYDLIARSNALGPLDMRAYLAGISNGLRASLLGHDSSIQIAVDAEPLAIGAEHAVSVGLLINELATNAIRHAFPQGPGRIVLWFRRRGDGVALTVQDDGIGLDAAAGPTQNAGLGMRFVEAFVQQLGGALTRTSGPTGTSVTVSLPASILAP